MTTMESAGTGRPVQQVQESGAIARLYSTNIESVEPCSMRA